MIRHRLAFHEHRVKDRENKTQIGVVGSINTQQRKCSKYDTDINDGRQSGCKARWPGRKSAAITQNARIAFARENNLDCELCVQPKSGAVPVAKVANICGEYILGTMRREKKRKPRQHEYAAGACWQTGLRSLRRTTSFPLSRFELL